VINYQSFLVQTQNLYDLFPLVSLSTHQEGTVAGPAFCVCKTLQANLNVVLLKLSFCCTTVRTIREEFPFNVCLSFKVPKHGHQEAVYSTRKGFVSFEVWTCTGYVCMMYCTIVPYWNCLKSKVNLMPEKEEKPGVIFYPAREAAPAWPFNSLCATRNRPWPFRGWTKYSPPKHFSRWNMTWFL
jgi:hypothetical protein